MACDVARLMTTYNGGYSHGYQRGFRDVAGQQTAVS